MVKLVQWLPMAAALLAGTAGCMPPPVAGPALPDSAAVSSIRVTPIGPAEGAPYEVSDGVAAIVSSRALSEHGWSAARGRDLAPLYRLDPMDGSRVVAVYWLGANSHPPRFPCYALCSGWWIGGSTEAGTFDATRYSGLTSGASFPLLDGLRLL